MARGGLASVDAAVTDHRAEKLSRLGLDRNVVGHLSPLQAQVSPLASARTLDAPARKLGEHGVAVYTEPASPTSWTPLAFQPWSRRSVWSDRSLNAKTGAFRENTALTSGAPSRSWRPDPPCHRRGRATPRLKHALQTHRAGRTRSESDRVVPIAGGENLGTFAAAPRERKLHHRFATESHCEPHTDAVL